MRNEGDDFVERVAAEEAEAVLDEEQEFGADVEVVARQKLDLGPDWDEEIEFDTTEVHLDDPDAWIRELSEPEWVIRGECVDEQLSVIKSGKEADVTLVRRSAGGRECLLACKRFRPRVQRAFRREEDYRAGQSVGDERVDRAVRKRSTYGRSILEYSWAYREFPLMRAAWQAGVRVPFPVEAQGEALLMQFIGDLDGPAPRLADVRLDRDEAEIAFEDIIENVRRLLDAYIVHADLSAFNILWWEDRAWIIDFPQAVDIARSDRGVEFLQRDLANLCRYFRRQGVSRDASEVLEDLKRTAPFDWR